MSKDMKGLYDDKRFDVRLIERHLQYPDSHEAHITQEELDARLAALPDCADKCEKIETKQPGAARSEEV